MLVAGILAAGAVAGAVVAWRHGNGGGSGGGAQASASGPVQLHGTTAYDPDAPDHAEHNAQAPLATDGLPGTAWSTSHYRYPNGGLGKQGVGLVLDAGKTVDLSELGIATDTPGFTAQIRAGDSAGGPFHAVSSSETVSSKTVFTLHDAKARYFVVWITKLGGGYDYAHVNEVSAG